ncbi:MAG: cryptochrome/photolyase family protein [Flavobacteriaceae bacterium]|nr:cryptochrome/photolyase family protein [Flavobacteriaceae bacterium]
MKTLRLILGDQLNIRHSWFETVSESNLYCMFEMRQETDYVKHHIQKVVGFFTAMREFSKQLEAQGHKVVYLTLDDNTNFQNLKSNLNHIIESQGIEMFEYQSPDEYRLDAQLQTFCNTLTVPFREFDTEHFYTKRDELSVFFKGKKQFLMERFYRYMRQKHHILMDGEQPEGGEWNYDKSNRNKWKGSPGIPSFLDFKNPVSDVLNTISSSDIDTIGRFVSTTFSYPINLQQALQQLDYFNQNLLVHFGDYQDALHNEEVYLFHSRLSFAMNLKLISPKEIVESVLMHYRANSEKISISQVEGFIRQVIGWREYMRGMYWAQMPKYKTLNTLDNQHRIPKFFWTGDTKMNCLSKTINNSLDNAYAHHIQRLMITGNYLLLTQTHPDEVDDWYLGIYIDALEWVQLPNTRGMSQFADGGLIATKPYVSSGSYINKMSNYCSECKYNVKERLGDNACPFNSLYWNFLDDKRPQLASNFRMKMMYSGLNKFSTEELVAMKMRASQVIETPENF